MKRIINLGLVVMLVLAFGAMVFANENEGTLENHGTVHDTIPVDVEILPYAHVIARKVVFEVDHWKWTNIDPIMAFGDYTGEAHQSKVADTNCFFVETNTPLELTFQGESLACKGSKMLTRYWLWRSVGTGEIPLLGGLIRIPESIVPEQAIGYFGEKGKAPNRSELFDPSGIDWLDFLLGLINHQLQWIWPTDAFEEDVVERDSIDEIGIYAYQVFGFAGTDEISSQRAGDYTGKIILTVSK